jgi:hypothetical protein
MKFLHRNLEIIFSILKENFGSGIARLNFLTHVTTIF